MGLRDLQWVAEWDEWAHPVDHQALVRRRGSIERPMCYPCYQGRHVGELEREHRQPARWPPQEGVVVELGLRAATAVHDLLETPRGTGATETLLFAGGPVYGVPTTPFIASRTS